MIPNLGTTTIDQTNIQSANGGYEFTGGFTDRISGTAGASDIGNDVEYTQAMVDSKCLGYVLALMLQDNKPMTNLTGVTQQLTLKKPLPSPCGTYRLYSVKALFSGAYMPQGVKQYCLPLVKLLI